MRKRTKRPLRKLNISLRYHPTSSRFRDPPLGDLIKFDCLVANAAPFAMGRAVVGLETGTQRSRKEFKNIRGRGIAKKWL